MAISDPGTGINMSESDMSVARSRQSNALRAFRFLDLPAEIRLLIYEELFLLKPGYSFAIHGRFFGDLPLFVNWNETSLSPSLINNLPALKALETCWTIYMEAVPILYGRNRLRMNTRFGLGRSRPWLTVKGFRFDLVSTVSLEVLLQELSTIHMKDIAAAIARMTALTKLQLKVAMRHNPWRTEYFEDDELVSRYLEDIVRVVPVSTEIICTGRLKVEPVRFYELFYMSSANLAEVVRQLRVVSGEDPKNTSESSAEDKTKEDAKDDFEGEAEDDSEEGIEDEAEDSPSDKGESEDDEGNDGDEQDY